MFGISFSEITVIAAIALVVVGPQKLPAMMRTLGEWLGKLRRLTSDMRAQTGIDDILREEGIDGVAELRSLLRGEHLAARRAGYARSPASAAVDPYAEINDPDPALEYPSEGPDIGDAIPDDLCSPALDDANRAPADPGSDPPPSGRTRTSRERPQTQPETPIARANSNPPPGDAAAPAVVVPSSPAAPSEEPRR